MKKKNSIIALVIVLIVGIVGTYVILNSGASKKIEKSLVSQPTFTVFGYDNETEAAALDSDVNVEVQDWNPESVAINLPTKNVSIRAIFDGLEAKLQFVEVTGEDGLIVSHFVVQDVVKIEEGSLLETYLKDLGIDQSEFVDYVKTLFEENNLRSKFDKYKSAFASFIQQN